MSNDRREDNYLWQNNGGDLTPRQAKRIRLHDNAARKPLTRLFRGLKRRPIS
jgi:hypothetical protein